MRLRVVKCEKCGGTVQLQQGAASAQCQQCGATVSLVEVLRVEEVLVRHFPNPTPLRLGMKAHIRGTEYELTGRVVLGMVEEGITYYWNEFELVSADGDCLFLEYDEGRWKLTETFVPQNPIGPNEAARLRPGARLVLNGGAVMVTEISRATVHFVEGELTYAAKVGDQVAYLDAGYGNITYTVQWSEDEIEFYRSRMLSDREVLVAFGLRKELAALEAREKRRRSQRMFAAVCLFLSLVAFMGWSVSRGGGTLVGRGEVPLRSIPADGVRFGPVNLNPGVHRLVIYASMTQASAWVAGVLESEDKVELVGTQRDFWDERGYDADGPWHEWDLRSQFDFVIKQPGRYYVRLYTELDTPSGNYGNAGYELRSGVIYPMYFLFYAIAALTVSIIVFCISMPENLKKLAESVGDDDD
ncbi:MAG: DUF4178 domain-containing protein [Abditibacteriales bacterium]|nr:DUF4178 domain-containing protein [Abditibacteriales bacterium]MDW8364801.1 DUF4178 domain-containing protein [Abditibacteriales bacterium]